MGGGKVTEFHENNTLSGRHGLQNSISLWTKPDSGEGFSTVENDRARLERRVYRPELILARLIWTNCIWQRKWQKIPQQIHPPPPKRKTRGRGGRGVKQIEMMTIRMTGKSPGPVRATQHHCDTGRRWWGYHPSHPALVQQRVKTEKTLTTKHLLPQGPKARIVKKNPFVWGPFQYWSEWEADVPANKSGFMNVGAWVIWLWETLSCHDYF